MNEVEKPAEARYERLTSEGQGHEGQRSHDSLLRRLISKLAHGWIPGRAAQMSFYFILSVFPILLILMAALGNFSNAQQVLRDNVMQQLAPLLPPSMYRIISDLLAHLAEHPKGLLTWGSAVALWAASSGMVATIDGLNQAYATADRRSWWRRRAVGLVLMLTVMLIVAMAIALMALAAPLAETLAQRMGVEPLILSAWRLVQWPAVFCLAVLAFDLIYHFGPYRPRPAWRWLPAETLIAIVLWLAATFGLRTYMTTIGNYSVLYGTVGGVIVLLLWCYLTAIAILAGAHIAVALRDNRGATSIGAQTSRPG